MKSILLTVGLAFIGMYATAQTRVIDYPVMGHRTTDALEFYQAEVSDTAVILRGDMYSRPNYWVRIASSSVLKGKETGKVYRLIRATGIKLDHEEYMPESWNRSFSLQFEPVDKRDRMVDYDEMIPEGNGFRVNDICLENKQINKKIHCRIEGTVANCPAYSRLMLMPEGTDPRVQGWISIPVRDGKFSYDLYTDREEPYELYAWSDNLQGAWYPTSFFSENGKIEIILHSSQAPEVYSDAPLTKELLRFKQETGKLFFDSLREEREKLEKENKILTPAALALQAEVEKAQSEEERKEIFQKMRQLDDDGKAYTEDYKALEKKSQEVNGKYKNYEKEYIRSNPTIVGLYLLKQQIRRMHDTEEASDIMHIYKTGYAGKFADNPMTDYMKLWIASREIKLGGKYIDFTAPDAEGLPHTLSKEIEGKVALIDLWASWCGPCRRSSISMIPVYEAYKDKGFTVVGVARERQADDMRKAVAKDKYPWLNLIELNDAGKIWEKYGIGNAGGGTFLVDKEGKILLIQPTAEEVKASLDKLLQ